MSEFPSPIGVPYISIKKDELIEAILKAVSVPYWGSLYFNLKLRTQTKQQIIFTPQLI